LSALPSSLARTPSLDRWIEVGIDGEIVISTGKVEIGQGILTALRLIAAEELDVEPRHIRMRTAETGVTPDEKVTAGSMSIEDSGAAVRQACAWARRLMLEKVADQPDQLEVNGGIVTGERLNAPTSYIEIQAGKLFDYVITELTSEKPPAAYQLLGRDGHVRLDLEAKVRGEGVFIQDLDFPGMMHGRVLRPPSYHHRLEALELPVNTPRDKLLVDGSFVAALSDDEYRAIVLVNAARRAAVWRQEREITCDGTITNHLVKHETGAYPLVDGVPKRVRLRTLSTEINAVYSRPYIMHGALGPSAAAARFDGGDLTVWSSSQGIELIRHTLSQILGLDSGKIRVVYVQGAGCYGHNGADDVTVDAALCARAFPGRPVLVKWSREDEHKWEPYGAAMRVGMGANLNAAGNVCLWTHDVWSFPHSSRPMPGREGVDVVAAWHLEEALMSNPPRPSLSAEAGIHRNALPIYDFPDQQVVKRFVANSPLRSSALRSLGAQANVFAIESFMDELALAAATDPLAFRRRHLHDRRARVVMDRVIELAGGLDGPRGIGLARYKNRQCCTAVIVEVDVNMNSAEVRVNHVWIAADAGCVVDRDGLVNQLEGGAIQALSWCLKEAVEFDADGVKSVDWQSYPILRFSEVPHVTTDIIDGPTLPSLGAGEAAQGPTSAALANAVFAGSGLRVRDLPITPERLREVASN